MKAIELFDELGKGIHNLIKASDIYTFHILSELRNEPLDMEALKNVIKGQLSGLNLFGAIYRENEIDILKREKTLTNIGQQIFLATHTALDIYLGEKFKEYYRFKSKNDSSFTEANLENINLNGIDRIKKQYSIFLDIRLNLFEVPYFNTTENCSFKPYDSWEAIQIIYRERNNIVHKGRTEKYEIILPPDAWYPFEFVCRWVQHFNVNFDANVYEGRTFQLIREYEERKSSLEKNGNAS